MDSQMESNPGRFMQSVLVSSVTVLSGIAMLVALLVAVSGTPRLVHADPLPRPEGYPKLSTSTKVVTPTLASPGGATLEYEIEIRNTGAYTAVGTTLSDVLPDNTSYVDAGASVGMPTFDGTTLTWTGDVGFDETVVVTLSVNVTTTFLGTVHNTAVITQPWIAKPVTVTAETVVADEPILAIAKTSTPSKPGANKLLTYELAVTNFGQPSVGTMTIYVTDTVPANTTFDSAGPQGSESGGVVEWMRDVSLDFAESTVFTFSVNVGNVPSGTVIWNDNYRTSSPQANLAVGEPYTVTIIDPVLRLSKYAWPDPPGSNREMTYTLRVLNVGSLATNLVVTDRIPAGVEYRRGGSEAGGIVSWPLSSLDTGESARLTYTVYISDVMDVPIVNADYAVRSDEGACQPGRVLTTVVWGPTFETLAMVDPIAKKPGGGGGPVTPTLVVRNLGPGNALGATARLEFRRISVSASDLYADPPGVGSLSPALDCGDKCVYFVWTGDLAYGEAITFTTIEGQSTIGGEEGTIYTATVVVSDTLSNTTTDPVEGTATGRITHFANLIPTKEAPPVIGRGQVMTYAIDIWNSGLTVDGLPVPVLTDVVPLSTTVIYVSDGGVASTVSETTVISWELPLLSTGERTERSFTVQVDNDLVSGTQLLNTDYGITWHDAETTTVYHNPGQPVTTTVVEAGLIDSFKTVEPVTVLPGPGNVLTFYLHIVNSGAIDLDGVTVYDYLPWQDTTYQRDAVASAGMVYSDIVSVSWTGSVAAFSGKVVTFTVAVDPDFQGTLTNTATISHPDLLNEVVVSAIAYVTEKPVLRISKSASPDPVTRGGELTYEIQVVNLGQQATELVITDTVPANTEYVPQSTTGGGVPQGDEIYWQIAVLEPGESHTVGFRVTVSSGDEVINDRYAVRCQEGIVSAGAPVVTEVRADSGTIYLPLALRNH